MFVSSSGPHHDVLTFPSGILFAVFSGISSGTLRFSPFFLVDREVPVEAWRCPLQSGAPGEGPALPTGEEELVWRRKMRKRMRSRGDDSCKI